MDIPFMYNKAFARKIWHMIGPECQNLSLSGKNFKRYRYSTPLVELPFIS